MTYWEHMVSQYSGLNLIEVSQLDIFEYWVLKRDAWIHHLSQTEKGQEYLDNAWICEQTTPDRQRLRAQFGRKDVVNNGGE
jgi:hypothetical protein